jgi:mono/diheme cytochrome c family protein
MHAALIVRILIKPSLAAIIAASLVTLVAAEELSPARQNSLVRTYCTVCHTDAAKNGGLSLEHYDAAQADPALAAMLLSKLRNGAMGAAGLGIPDKGTREAWIAATTIQSAGAMNWTVIHRELPGTKPSIVTASIVREVPPRKPETEAPLYRLTLACKSDGHQGEMQLAWSPQPQTNRTFFVSADGQPGIAHKLVGEEKMGNGTAEASGLASITLNAPMPRKTLAVTGLFDGETATFPVDALDQHPLQELAACFPKAAAH